MNYLVWIEKNGRILNIVYYGYKIIIYLLIIVIKNNKELYLYFLNRHMQENLELDKELLSEAKITN